MGVEKVIYFVNDGTSLIWDSPMEGKGVEVFYSKFVKQKRKSWKKEWMKNPAIYS